MKEEQEQINKVQQELDEMLAKIEEDKYKNQGYKNGVDVTISGTTFSQIVQHNANVRVTLESFRDSVNKFVDRLTEDADKLAVQMMREHIKHIESGQTVSYEELDKLDAKAEINERDTTRKSKK